MARLAPVLARRAEDLERQAEPAHPRDHRRRRGAGQDGEPFVSQPQPRAGEQRAPRPVGGVAAVRGIDDEPARLRHCPGRGHREPERLLDRQSPPRGGEHEADGADEGVLPRPRPDEHRVLVVS
jgi:hypothetical protein